MPSFFKWDQPSRLDAAEAKKAEAEKQWRAVCKAVDERDGRRCRACDKRSNPDGTGLLMRGHRHHLKYRSAGGGDTTANLITLCATCHGDEHRNKLRIVGNADEAVTFFRKDEREGWYVEREEIAVRAVRKD